MTPTLQIRLQICFSPTNATRSICVGPVIVPQANSSVCCNWLAWVPSDVKAGGFAKPSFKFCLPITKVFFVLLPDGWVRWIRGIWETTHLVHEIMKVYYKQLSSNAKTTFLLGKFHTHVGDCITTTPGHLQCDFCQDELLSVAFSFNLFDLGKAILCAWLCTEIYFKATSGGI